jgi:hypothetical protein
LKDSDESLKEDIPQVTDIENETLIQLFAKEEIKMPFSKCNIIKFLDMMVFQLNSIRSSERF